MDQSQKEKVDSFVQELSSISPSLCLAKWQQVTLHLQTGKTHSCHHPVPHKIPINEIKVDVSALHNTSYKKEQRKEMLEGSRPNECSYCWKVEDSNNNTYSDRITKSIDYWARPFLNKIATSNYAENVDPTYLEVSFSNTCNFKCSYCSPEISSKWAEEIKQFGAYPTTTRYNNLEWLEQTNSIPIPERDFNPYVEAFWKWWPDLYPKLQVLRITGGEPLLTKHTFTVFEYILNNPRPELELNINSNLCVPEKQYDLFLTHVKKAVESQSIKQFKLYTSCESVGLRAEYIRYGLSYNQWLENCYKFLDTIPEAKLTIMSTYNALSVSSFDMFLTDVDKLKRYKPNSVSIDISMLRWPEHLSINILTDDFLPIIESHKTFMKSKNTFQSYEINRMERVFLDNKNTYFSKRDFTVFVDEHDRRRGTNFLKTFPEMRDFYQGCKNES
jgi:organic radical activating enzyme